jgi:hypothetical protein
MPCGKRKPKGKRVGKPNRTQYEYKEVKKEACTSCLAELNALGKEGWLVVTFYGNTFVLVREK